MDEDLKQLKAYMHVDHDDDDNLIRSLWRIRVKQLQKNGIPVDGPDSEGWLAAAGLTLQDYDGTPLQPGIRSLINGLKLDDPMF